MVHMSTSIYSARPRPLTPDHAEDLRGGLSLQFLGAPQDWITELPLRRNDTLSHHPLQCVHPVDSQRYTALPTPTIHPSTLVDPDGRFGWWDRTGCAVAGGRGGVTWLRYHQLVPPTPWTSPHTPPGMDSTPWLYPAYTTPTPTPTWHVRDGGSRRGSFQGHGPVLNGKSWADGEMVRAQTDGLHVEGCGVMMGEVGSWWGRWGYEGGVCW